MSIAPPPTTQSYSQNMASPYLPYGRVHVCQCASSMISALGLCPCSPGYMFLSPTPQQDLVLSNLQSVRQVHRFQGVRANLGVSSVISDPGTPVVLEPSPETNP